MKTFLAAILIPLSVATIGCDHADDPEVQALMAEAEAEEAFEEELVAASIDPDSVDDDEYERAFAIYMATHDTTPPVDGPTDLIHGGSVIVDPPCLVTGCGPLDSPTEDLRALSDEWMEASLAIPEGVPLASTDGATPSLRCPDANDEGVWYHSEDPQECVDVSILCAAGWAPIRAECGCGCERFRHDAPTQLAATP